MIKARDEAEGKLDGARKSSDDTRRNAIREVLGLCIGLIICPV